MTTDFHEALKERAWAEYQTAGLYGLEEAVELDQDAALSQRLEIAE